MLDQKKIKELQMKACQLRMDTLRSVYESPTKFGHIGGSYSCMEIVTLLYYHVMNIDKTDPRWDGRDRFLMSKGHSCSTQYSVLADIGYIDKKHLKEYKTPHGILQGHPDWKKCPGIEATTGSLGQGLSISVGMCLAAKRSGKSHRIYTLLGESELQSGMTWEAIMSAAHYKCDNLIVFIDRNRLQVCGDCDAVMNMEPIEARFEAAGWFVNRIDGHDFVQLDACVSLAQKSDKPSVIICDTIKGKGVSFMENVREWHACEVNDEDYEKAMAELNREYQRLAE